MKINFKYGYILLIFLIFQSKTFADKADYCQNWNRWIKPACQRLNQIWYEGYNELYITGYAWHNRYTYSPERVKTYNENAWGGGLGRGLIDEKGNWHGLYAFAFLDSHKYPEPIVGYAWSKLFYLNPRIRPGIGLGAFLSQRPDINNGIPFPGALPWLSLFIDKVTISATYIPGHQDVGNVLFVFAKYKF